MHQLGSSGLDFAYGVARDRAGNVYIAGSTRGTFPGSAEANPGASDIFVAQYSPSGQRRWVHQLGSAEDDRGYAIAMGLTGTAYLAGASLGSLPGSPEANAGEFDAFVAFYAATGRMTAW